MNIIVILFGIASGLFIVVKMNFQLNTINKKEKYKSVGLPSILGLIAFIICAILPTGKSFTIERFISAQFFLLGLYCCLWYIRNVFGWDMKYFKFPTKTLKEYSNGNQS